MPSSRARVAQVWRRPWSFSLGSASSGVGLVVGVLLAEELSTEPLGMERHPVDPAEDPGVVEFDLGPLEPEHLAAA